MRFYELDGGRITLDGVDIATMRRDELRGEIGMVLQDTWLFGGTIRDNIAYGRPGATDERDPRRGRRRATSTASSTRCPTATTPCSTRRRATCQRRAEAADHHRPGVPRPAVAADPRRGDQRGRHPHRAARAARDGGAARQPHQLRDRAPAVDDPRRRPDPGDGGRPDRRAGHHAELLAGTARTSGSTGPSSPRRAIRRRCTPVDQLAGNPPTAGLPAS